MALDPLIGQIALVAYAILLAVGGLIGFLKARSNASLIAGLTSGLAALGCAALLRVDAASPSSSLVGATLAVMMLIIFGIRLGKTRRFMPSGLLCIVSAAVLILMLVYAAAM